MKELTYHIYSEKKLITIEVTGCPADCKIGRAYKREKESWKMKFTKMQAFGNDYVYIDAIHQELKNLPELARFVSNRHFAIGSDGMVLICPSEKGDFRMRMFNPDGSEGEMCGNALRSVGKYVYDHRLTDKTELVIETLGGMQHLNLTVTDGYVSNIRADIGEPRLSTKVIPINTDSETFIDQPVQV